MCGRDVAGGGEVAGRRRVAAAAVMGCGGGGRGWERARPAKGGRRDVTGQG